MRTTRLVWAFAVVAVCLTAAGCVDGGSSGGGGTAAPTSASKDSAFVAEKAARRAMEAVDPDAVVLTAGSGGVVLNPPPASWNFLYGSKAKGRIYQVTVDHGKAGTPVDMAELNPETVDLTKAIPVDTIKIGSKQAYEDGRAYVEKRDGSVPPNVMMSISFIEVPGLENQSVGDWSIAFLKGTSTEGMQQVRVNGATGQVTELE